MQFLVLKQAWLLLSVLHLISLQTATADLSTIPQAVRHLRNQRTPRPTQSPTQSPSLSPSSTPTVFPSDEPSTIPSNSPSGRPSSLQSMAPSTAPPTTTPPTPSPTTPSPVATTPPPTTPSPVETTAPPTTAAPTTAAPTTASPTSAPPTGPTVLDLQPFSLTVQGSTAESAMQLLPALQDYLQDRLRLSFASTEEVELLLRTLVESSSRRRLQTAEFELTYEGSAWFGTPVPSQAAVWNAQALALADRNALNQVVGNDDVSIVGVRMGDENMVEPPSSSNDISVGMIVGIVAGVVAVLVLAVLGTRYYRNHVLPPPPPPPLPEHEVEKDLKQRNEPSVTTDTEGIEVGQWTPPRNDSPPPTNDTTTLITPTKSFKDDDDDDDSEMETFSLASSTKGRTPPGAEKWLLDRTMVDKIEYNSDSESQFTYNDVGVHNFSLLPPKNVELEQEQQSQEVEASLLFDSNQTLVSELSFVDRTVPPTLESSLSPNTASLRKIAASRDSEQEEPWQKKSEDYSDVPSDELFGVEQDLEGFEAPLPPSSAESSKVYMEDEEDVSMLSGLGAQIAMAKSTLAIETSMLSSSSSSNKRVVGDNNSRQRSDPGFLGDAHSFTDSLSNYSGSADDILNESNESSLSDFLRERRKVRRAARRNRESRKQPPVSMEV